MTTWEMICGEDAEKALTICVCVHLEGEKRGGGGLLEPINIAFLCLMDV